MKYFKKIYSLLKNKYIIAIAVFIFLMVFYDRNDIFVQIDRKKELHDLLKSKQFYEKENAGLQKQLTDLENNPAALEKFAREKLYMKRDNEDVFIIDSPADSLPEKK
jgi:cell division protein FtsB